MNWCQHGDFQWTGQANTNMNNIYFCTIGICGGNGPDRAHAQSADDVTNELPDVDGIKRFKFDEGTIGKDKQHYVIDICARSYFILYVAVTEENDID